MPRYDVVLTREVTLTVTVVAGDEDRAGAKAETLANDHIGVRLSTEDKVPHADDYEISDEGEWSFAEIHDA